jgi:hypothetical protein
VVEVVPLSDDLDDYEENVERADELEDVLHDELTLADAEELDDVAAEDDETGFDEARLEYSGVEEGDGDVDMRELDEAGALLDDPEREAPTDDR